MWKSWGSPFCCRQAQGHRGRKDADIVLMRSYGIWGLSLHVHSHTDKGQFHVSVPRASIDCLVAALVTLFMPR